MDRIFQIAAVALMVAAAYFLWTGNRDGAFVSAVLAACAFFLGIRVQAKARNAEREAERQSIEQAALESGAMFHGTNETVETTETSGTPETR